jgi:sec-independent protein translocase protein TatB
MLSLPHLVVLFVIALVVFGPEKLPELARMLGKATGEFRKMTNDFRYALEDEVRELERQTRIKQEEAAAAARSAQAPAALPTVAPEGAIAREPSPAGPGSSPWDTPSDVNSAPQADSNAPQTPADSVSVPHEKPSDDNTAV